MNQELLFGRFRGRNINQRPAMDEPARYQIQVQGRLSDRWSVEFEDMTVTARCEVDGPTITILDGTVVDQAALHGLLNRIMDLGLPLLLVKRMGVE